MHNAVVKNITGSVFSPVPCLAAGCCCLVTLLRDDRVANDDGTFSYTVQADNGINTAVEGVVGSAVSLEILFDEQWPLSIDAGTKTLYLSVGKGSALKLLDLAPPPSFRIEIVLACLAAVAVAAKLEDRVVTLLRDDRVANEDGTFSYAVQADNGINTAVEGVVGSAGQINQQGSYTLLEIAERQRAAGIVFN
ncbi:hypothetical protein C7M84_025334 [Penaeus vannamei]|uniref:Uncharacterized protein n=1 Tax=Penaeus vannamei TaxID=6689 RepID=A0A423TYF0_PENVA|nr:hypothetical protein C7M84_025334 [Penaeus vannamei]